MVSEHLVIISVVPNGVLGGWCRKWGTHQARTVALISRTCCHIFFSLWCCYSLQALKNNTYYCIMNFMSRVKSLLRILTNSTILGRAYILAKFQTSLYLQKNFIVAYIILTTLDSRKVCNVTRVKQRRMYRHLGVLQFSFLVLMSMKLLLELMTLINNHDDLEPSQIYSIITSLSRRLFYSAVATGESLILLLLLLLLYRFFQRRVSRCLLPYYIHLFACLYLNYIHLAAERSHRRFTGNTQLPFVD